MSSPLYCENRNLLVRRNLDRSSVANSKRLGYLASALIALAASQVVYMVANDPLCKASKQKVDGSFIATLLETISVVLLVVTWSSITEGV